MSHIKLAAPPLPTFIQQQQHLIQPQQTQIQQQQQQQLLRKTKQQHYVQHQQLASFGNDDEFASVRSMLSINFYLHTINLGGETVFYKTFDYATSQKSINNSGSNEQQADNEEEKEPVVYKVQPKAGDCIIFVHNVRHAGAQIPMHSKETKYLLRTDAMYAPSSAI